MRSVLALTISLICISGTTQNVYAMRGFEPPATAEAGRGDDPVSFQNPQTYGEMRPRLSGKVNQIRLKTDDADRVWLAQVHKTRGAVQAWGDGLLTWDGESLSQMDEQLRHLVDLNYDAFKVKSKDLAINKSRTNFAGPFRTVTYDRYFWMEDAVRFKVSKAFMTFRFKYGRLIQITNFTFGEIGIIEAPVISADDAMMTVAEDVMLQEGLDKINAQVSIELQPFFIKGGDVRFRMVYQVGVEKKRPEGLYYYSVSALDGSVVQILNGLMSAAVLGEVTPRLATDEVIQVPMPYATVTGSGGKESADARGEFGMDPTSAMAQLMGAHAKVLVNGSQIPQAPSNESGNILFSGGKFLDESMAYFHVNRTNAFVSQFISNPFLKGGITVNTRVTTGPMKACNAWYSPSKKDLNFLNAGSANDHECESSARIADVIYHEWGHALDDALGGIQDGAFSEAIGDINAFLQTGDSKLAPTFFKGDDRPIRDVSVVKVYPRDRDRNPHAEGLIVGGAWWDFFSAMREKYGPQEGQTKTAAVFYKHLASADSYMESSHGALVADDDDGDLSNCTPHMCMLNSAFARHGLAQYDDRCRQKTCGGTTMYLDD